MDAKNSNPGRRTRGGYYGTTFEKRRRNDTHNAAQSKPPARPDHWMPLYFEFFENCSRDLEPICTVSVIALCIEYWKNGPLPKNDRKLAKIAGLTSRRWGRNRDQILSVFDCRGTVVVPLWYRDGKKVRDRISAKRRAAANVRWKNERKKSMQMECYVSPCSKGGSKGGAPNAPETQKRGGAK